MSQRARFMSLLSREVYYGGSGNMKVKKLKLYGLMLLTMIVVSGCSSSSQHTASQSSSASLMGTLQSQQLTRMKHQIAGQSDGDSILRARWKQRLTYFHSQASDYFSSPLSTSQSVSGSQEQDLTNLEENK